MSGKENVKVVSNKYYFILLSIGVGLLLFVFYFTHLRYDLIRQSNNSAKKTNEAVHAYEELSDDYKSSVILYASTGLVSAKYLGMYSGDADDIIPDVEQIKMSADDIESRKRADTLEQRLKEQTKWILKPRIENTQLSDETDSKLAEISDTKAIIDRGEIHIQERLLSHKEELTKSFSLIYQWLLILISSSATLIIIVVISILWHIKKGKKNVQKIGLQKDRLDEIAWIQSHKVRSQVATILGLGKLFNHADASDPINVQILLGFQECTEKLDKIIREIDGKTRVSEEKINKIIALKSPIIEK